ncbi:MAG: hypothetical protein EBU90_03935 [Proteobacteria bacterium]|nr:hypothetical protein [Pseudomonadota bacterium]NBP14220.1 hypothetical protein [bacterium]
MSSKYIIANDGNVTAVVSGQTYCFGKSHPNYSKLVGHLKTNNVEHFEACYDIVSHINAYCEGYVNCEHGSLSWDGIKMPNMFTSTIMDMVKQGFPFEPMLNFLDNMSQNPSDHAIVELFDFMENKHMPITMDGCFLSYKAVRSDYKDIYSGKFDNSVGSICEVPRQSVDNNRNNGCGKGLHVGAIDYAKSYGGIDLDNDGGNDDGNHLMICKVNPRDVVSVPHDSKFQKLRTCRYEVVAKFDSIFDKVIHFTENDKAYMATKKRNREWMHEIAVKLDKINTVISRCRNLETVNV